MIFRSINNSVLTDSFNNKLIMNIQDLSIIDHIMYYLRWCKNPKYHDCNKKKQYNIFIDYDTIFHSKILFREIINIIRVINSIIKLNNFGRINIFVLTKDSSRNWNGWKNKALPFLRKLLKEEGIPTNRYHLESCRYYTTVERRTPEIRSIIDITKEYCKVYEINNNWTPINEVKYRSNCRYGLISLINNLYQDNTSKYEIVSSILRHIDENYKLIPELVYDISNNEYLRTNIEQYGYHHSNISGDLEILFKIKIKENE